MWLENIRPDHILEIAGFFVCVARNFAVWILGPVGVG